MANPAWVKGVSGNPGGRTRGDVVITEVCRGHTKEAIDVLLECMRQKKNLKIRAFAATYLLDRGYGKIPIAELEQSRLDNPPIVIQIESEKS